MPFKLGDKVRVKTTGEISTICDWQDENTCILSNGFAAYMWNLELQESACGAVNATSSLVTIGGGVTPAAPFLRGE